MFDWIKYFPLGLKVDHKPSEVRGPYFTKPKQVKWRFGDSTLYLDAPRSNPVFSFSGRGRPVNALTPRRKDILKTIGPRPNEGRFDDPTTRWKYHIFYSNTWYFVGPWFTGEQASLSVKASLDYVSTLSTFYNKNMFHPNVFESAVADILDGSYGYRKNGSGRKAHYRGPLNWRVLPLSDSIQGVVCDVHCVGNSCNEDPTLHRLVYIPVTPSLMLSIILDFGGAGIYTDEIRSKPLFELCNSIIDSMRLEVGEHTQAEWDKVKATCPDMSITDTFGELPWPLTKEKPSKKRKEKDITSKPSRVERLHSG